MGNNTAGYCRPTIQNGVLHPTNEFSCIFLLHQIFSCLLVCFWAWLLFNKFGLLEFIIKDKIKELEAAPILLQFCNEPT